MGMLIEGSNLVRNFWSNLIDAIEIGTGTTKETAQDSDVETVIVGSESTNITNTTADQYLKKIGILPGVLSSNESVTECVWKKQSPELASSRITFPTITWENDKDLTITTKWYFKGKQG